MAKDSRPPGPPCCRCQRHKEEEPRTQNDIKTCLGVDLGERARTTEATVSAFEFTNCLAQQHQLVASPRTRAPTHTSIKMKIFALALALVAGASASSSATLPKVGGSVEVDCFQQCSQVALEGHNKKNCKQDCVVQYCDYDDDDYDDDDYR